MCGGHDGPANGASYLSCVLGKAGSRVSKLSRVAIAARLRPLPLIEPSRTAVRSCLLCACEGWRAKAHSSGSNVMSRVSWDHPPPGRTSSITHKSIYARRGSCRGTASVASCWAIYVSPHQNPNLRRRPFHSRHAHAHDVDRLVVGTSARATRARGGLMPGCRRTEKPRKSIISSSILELGLVIQ